MDQLTSLIARSLDKVIPIIEKDLKANKIDIIFIAAAKLAIPEYGIGGNSPGPNHIYVAFDPKSSNISQQGLEETLFHEVHHCMRWRDPGYGHSLGEALVSEGLACLYEEQKTGHTPIYAKIKLDSTQVNLAKKSLESKNYNHSRWFYGGQDIDKWFGYSYGYKLCKEYSVNTHKKASELVHVPARTILNLH